MGKKQKGQRDTGFDMIETLDEALSGVGAALWYVLIAGDGVAGCEDTPGAYLISRCLLEAEWKYAFDEQGRCAPFDRTTRGLIDPAAEGALTRIRKVVSKGLRVGVPFVLCYHVEGDPGWYMAWSDHYDPRSADDALKDFVRGGMLW